MARQHKKKTPKNLSPRIVNRRARFDYHLSENLECGIQLTGSEVKSVRLGQVSLAEGFARVDPRTGELWLLNVEISQYPHAHGLNHEPKRPRKLLARKRQIDKYAGATTNKGVTLIPLAMYFSERGMIKIEVALAEGKKTHDKRQDLKKKEADREIRRGMTRRVL